MRPIPKPTSNKCNHECYNDVPGKSSPKVMSNKPLKNLREKSFCPYVEPFDFNFENQEKNVGGDVSGVLGNLSRIKGQDVNSSPKINQAQSQEAREIALRSEKWFHGAISRVSAESLLKNDGDFLVRESQNTKGQFVLTGMKYGQKKHLLLIDPEGDKI